ncbi:uncharacterized protein LOC120216488 [Hibiscus syriacus]|uniref:uncharacterized protein LOC120216488 n=1 Tax=Hibiscus syriacus TaxID=106335 RepID=UPI001924DFA8|nr:uncharacterized protein LOC120216488 [Hibiscus syriacus]
MQPFQNYDVLEAFKCLFLSLLFLFCSLGPFSSLLSKKVENHLQPLLPVADLRHSPVAVSEHHNSPQRSLHCEEFGSGVRFSKGCRVCHKNAENRLAPLIAYLMASPLDRFDFQVCCSLSSRLTVRIGRRRYRLSIKSPAERTFLPR